MKRGLYLTLVRLTLAAAFAATTTGIIITTITGAQQPAQQDKPFEPQVGQAGKDVVWVPTSPELLTKMLDMAAVTPQDYVVDLGSGDGRNIIAAAKRGATARGFEFNPQMVELSRRLAKEAGVSDKATFVEGDMYEADFSTASVLALFLLPGNLEQLRDKFLALKPGTRIVVNTFGIPGWEADETDRVGEPCTTWCTSMLYFVPAKVAGTWRLPQGELALTQEFQKLAGTLTSGGAASPVENGKLKGDQISFTVGSRNYTGRVTADRMEITTGSGSDRQTMTAARSN
jgi:SAM-dependent methyltransferase